MFKTIGNQVWAFDCEWVPDVTAGRLLYDLSEDMTDREVMDVMWKKGGATEEDPYPYLKTALCKVVSVSMVQRRSLSDGSVDLRLHWLPRDPPDEEQRKESNIIFKFLDAVGRFSPQLVGYNSLRADLKIMVQRAVILGVQARQFGTRPDKPWEGVDYFSDHSESNVDLMRVLGTGGKGTPSLNELAMQCGFPGKMDTDGQMVAHLWLDGRLEDIIAYNNCDALTTYLLWLRVAHFAGHISTPEYESEQEQLQQMIQDLCGAPDMAYLTRYIREWDRLKAATLDR